MKITVFTHKEEIPRYEKLLLALANETIPLEYIVYDDYDDFISGFSQGESQAVIVARRGADGMECARNAKVLKPDIPLIWFSDDQGFGVESYRISCAYFSAEPITETLLSTALARCKSDMVVSSDL